MKVVSKRKTKPDTRLHTVGLRLDRLEYDAITQFARSKRTTRAALLRWAWLQYWSVLVKENETPVSL
jgi:hypothetical protein